MKKWLPFSSLIEQSEYLEKMLYEKYKKDKPLIFNERARKIDSILRSYDFKTPLKMKIYYDGYLYDINEIITFIDKRKKIVYFKDYFLPVKNIIDIEENDPFLFIS